MIWDRIHKDIRNKSEVARTSDTDTMSKGSSSYTDNITVTASDIDTTSPSISEVSVKELPCPQCNIMFPSEHSLRSHLHYHEQYKFNQAKVVGSVEEKSKKSNLFKVRTYLNGRMFNGLIDSGAEVICANPQVVKHLRKTVRQDNMEVLPQQELKSVDGLPVASLSRTLFKKAFSLHPEMEGRDVTINEIYQAPADVVIPLHLLEDLNAKIYLFPDRANEMQFSAENSVQERQKIS